MWLSVLENYVKYLLVSRSEEREAVREAFFFLSDPPAGSGVGSVCDCAGLDNAVRE